MSLLVRFVRHGATDALGKRLSGRRSPAPLNDEGRAQARAVAASLTRHPIAAVYSSPVERAVQTAEEIAAALDANVEIVEALNEIDFGDWTGATFAELDRADGWSFWNQSRSQHRPPGGESMLEVQSRVALWLDGVRRAHSAGEVVAVSHADVIKAALAYALGLSLDHHARLEIDPASLSTVVVETWGLRIRCVNEVVPWTA